MIRLFCKYKWYNLLNFIIQKVRFELNFYTNNRLFGRIIFFGNQSDILFVQYLQSCQECWFKFVITRNVINFKVVSTLL
jgi:hypothetical protein